jgi:hypothetical protein
LASDAHFVLVGFLKTVVSRLILFLSSRVALCDIIGSSTMLELGFAGLNTNDSPPSIQN